LAADICVYFTIKEAIKECFNVNLIENATKPLNPEDFEKQQEELKSAGVQIINSNSIA
jgi:nicotinamidase/pyrazinamidase